MLRHHLVFRARRYDSLWCRLLRSALTPLRLRSVLLLCLLLSLGAGSVSAPLGSSRLSSAGKLGSQYAAQASSQWAPPTLPVRRHSAPPAARPRPARPRVPQTSASPQVASVRRSSRDRSPRIFACTRRRGGGAIVSAHGRNPHAQADWRQPSQPRDACKSARGRHPPALQAAPPRSTGSC